MIQDQDRDRYKRAETKTKTETKKIGLETETVFETYSSGWYLSTLIGVYVNQISVRCLTKDTVLS